MNKDRIAKALKECKASAYVNQIEVEFDISRKDYPDVFDDIKVLAETDALTFLELLIDNTNDALEEYGIEAIEGYGDVKTNVYDDLVSICCYYDCGC